MYLVDYHIHTKRCGHACGEDREYVEAALKKGFREIGFSDHVPRFYEPPSSEVKVTERGMAREELDDYVESVIKLRDEYREISIKLGLEVDYVPSWERETEAITTQYPWDYIIGSVHFISEWNYGYIANEKEHGPEEIYPVYFDRVAQAAESGLFDILAHVDLPKRSFPRLEPEVMTELYRDLAIRLGKAGTVIELNSYGVRGSKLGDVGVYPDQELLRFCRGQGVRVTMGSDAHRPQDVGADFDRVTELLRKVGYREIAVFNRRKRSMVEWEA
ncbi:MAG: histidinol-phosphatase HisJ family protein [Firmicutes bacterium]|nr:histidinol-phosphatase HisJ family protein [Bacillota bacterium]